MQVPNSLVRRSCSAILAWRAASWRRRSPSSSSSCWLHNIVIFPVSVIFFKSSLFFGNFNRIFSLSMLSICGVFGNLFFSTGTFLSRCVLLPSAETWLYKTCGSIGGFISFCLNFYRCHIWFASLLYWSSRSMYILWSSRAISSSIAFFISIYFSITAFFSILAAFFDFLAVLSILDPYLTSAEVISSSLAAFFCKSISSYSCSYFCRSSSSANFILGISGVLINFYAIAMLPAKLPLWSSSSGCSW